MRLGLGGERIGNLQWKVWLSFWRLGRSWCSFYDIVQETGIKTIPKKNKCKKAKWQSKGALQIAEQRTEAKEKERKKEIHYLVLVPATGPELALKPIGISWVMGTLNVLHVKEVTWKAPKYGGWLPVEPNMWFPTSCPLPGRGDELEIEFHGQWPVI